MKLFYACVYVLTCELLAIVTGYDTCKLRSQDFLGYTYKIDRNTSEKVWSHCDFPNPVADPAFCGRVSSSLTNYACDPDYMLSSASQGISEDYFMYACYTF